MQQLIPLPEAADYQTQIKAKEQAGKAKRAERYDLRYQFWSQLLDVAKSRTDLLSDRRPNPSMVLTSANVNIKPGMSFQFVVRETDSQVELYIDVGTEDENLEALRELQQHEPEIQKIVGDGLEGQELPDKRACRIRKIIEGGYRSSQSDWTRIVEALVEAMIRLDNALRPFVKRG